MPVVRIYVPIGRRELEDLAGQGLLDAAPTSPRHAFAVTDVLRSQAAGLDVEELEYSAFSDAVGASAGVRSSPEDRRIVAAADADPTWVVAREGGPASSVDLVAPVPLSRIASFHVDEGAGEMAGGDADDLLWYDVTELDEVRTLFP
ncbi:DUF6912 family protein [Intrasporangium sp.]|uniref:DUF6912 family protein n=1 Tax=Intrasporangium sp. TaxID=1925024 RepID=UPI0029396A87|nr:hypothetical protein [Intrasporangium sp.]MDV3220052.1 hypothetical protein [Intrasporangium sp.]